MSDERGLETRPSARDRLDRSDGDTYRMNVTDIV
jgi:hypothetical protein